MLAIRLICIFPIAVSAESPDGGCKYDQDTDVGDPSTVVKTIWGDATKEHCCEACWNNSDCSVSVVLPASYGRYHGCWLKSGEGKVQSGQKGKIACRTGKPIVPKEKPKLTLLPAGTKGRCMDGSRGGFYHAQKPDYDSWVIDLQGGGECASASMCYKKRWSHLGSSSYFPSTQALKYLSQDSYANPLLRTFNRVFIPYCSQDLWTGQVEKASNDTFGYYFSGHLILEAVLDQLDPLGLKDAKRIVLTGESAGGIGVWPNLDWLAQRYPHARVVGAPIAGFYFYADPYTGPGSTFKPFSGNDFREVAWPAHFKLWQSFVDEDCAKNIDPWRCVLANNTFPYVSSEAFIFESSTDEVVTTAHDGVPHPKHEQFSKPALDYLHEWNRNMTIALSPSMAPSSRNGVFNPACFMHTGFLASGPLLKGKNYIQVFTDWYVNGPSPDTKLQDSCGILCNPTCSHWIGDSAIVV